MGTHTLNTALASALSATLAAASGPGNGRARNKMHSGAGVLRGSVEAGTFEHLFFAAPAKGETDRLVRAARKLLDAGRRGAQRRTRPQPA